MATYKTGIISWKEAADFVAAHHRHNRPPKFHVVSLGAWDDGRLVAVCMMGRPIAREFDDGRTLEVSRLCTLDGAPNACSTLYSAAARIAREKGCHRILTYTLAGPRAERRPLTDDEWADLGMLGPAPRHHLIPRSDWTERASSLEAAGWTWDGQTSGRAWDKRAVVKGDAVITKERSNDLSGLCKSRWVRRLSPATTTVTTNIEIAIPRSDWTMTTKGRQVLVTHGDGRQVTLTFPENDPTLSDEQKQWDFKGPSGWHHCYQHVDDRSNPFSHLTGFLEHTVKDQAVCESVYAHVEALTGIGRYAWSELVDAEWREFTETCARKLTERRRLLTTDERAELRAGLQRAAERGI